MSELGIHQGDDGFGDFQSLPSSPEGEIASDDVGRSVEPQADLAEKDVRISGREQDGGVKRDILRFSDGKVFVYGFVEMLAAVSSCNAIHLLLALLLVLCPLSVPGDLYVNHHVDWKDLHQKISEIRIVETPLHSVRSVIKNGTSEYKMARHDFLLLRTAGDKWYKAEKNGPSSGQVGFHFCPVTGPGDETIRFRSSISVDFSLAQALANLTKHELDYNLWEGDYWKYAHSRAEAILNSCIEIASDDDLRNELEKELENVMDARRLMPNEVVDIVQPWNILWGLLPCFTAVYCHFWLGYFVGWDSRPSFSFNEVANYSFLVGMASIMVDPNPVLWTYNLTGLATTYRWHFNFLSFLGYYVGWTVFLRGVDSWILELEKHTEEPCLRTVVSAREDHEIPAFRANCRQDDSKDDQRKQWPPRTLLFGLVLLLFVTTSEQALGYSVKIVCLRWFFVWCGLVVTKGFFSMAGLREVMRYIFRSWTH